MPAPLLALAGLLLAAAPAQAGPAEGDLRFSSLRLERDGLHWAWAPASAQVLAAHGVTPTLVLREGHSLLWSAPLSGSEGVVPLPRRPGPQARIEVVGFDGAWEVRSVAGARAPWQASAAGPRPELCQGFVDDESGCLAALTRIPGDPVQVVRACDQAFTTDDAELRCVQALDRPVPDPVQVVVACDRAFASDDRALDCIAVADRGPIIDACDDAFISDTAELSCMRLAPGPESVRACDNAFVSESDELACLSVLHETLGDRPDIVRTCADTATTDAKELACIRTVGQGQRR